jgi:cobalt-zinc-cadmium efflux system outer membrane protein
MSSRLGFMGNAGLCPRRSTPTAAPEATCGSLRLPAVLLGLALLVWAGRAGAQAPTVDTSVPGLPGSSTSLLGQTPGAGGGSFSNLPGSGGYLGGRAGVSAPRNVPTAVTTPPTGPGPTEFQMPVTAPQPAPVSPVTTRPYGTLEIPSLEDEGPPAGLTLDGAIATTLDRSMDLRAKFYEIPMARADTLQAGLRSNPVFYQDGQLLQYPGTSSQFTRAAPGGPSQVDTNVSYPLDISHKRQARALVATRAERVLEAQYQDAVRSRIDDVYGAYVNLLAARQTVRYSTSSVKNLEQMLELTQDLYKKGQIPVSDMNLAEIKLRISRLGLRDSEAAYRKTKLDLGALMNLTSEEANAIEPRGSIRDDAPAPPVLVELLRMALEGRPDVLSFRLGVIRSEADVKLAKANALSDVYVLYQPYTLQNNAPYGLRSQISWALGVTVPLPIYNRNQGGILRAKLNVTQTQIQLADLERQVKIDVEKAVQEYDVTKRLVTELITQVVPEARSVRDSAFRRWQQGQTSLLEYFQAQLDYNDVIKQYLDTSVRHRLSMLSLNTTVGQRIMP